MITVNEGKAKAIHNDKQRRLRAAAFKTELDPMTMKVVRGEATVEDLQAMAADIRERFPYLD